MKTVTIIFLAALMLVSADESRGLTISGSSEVSFRVTFIVIYSATRQTKLLCRDFNVLSGMWTGRAKEHLYHVIVNEHDRYSIEVPLTEIEPGTCEWRPVHIMYTLSSPSVPEEAVQRQWRGALLVTEYEESRDKSHLPVTHLTMRCRIEQYLCFPDRGIGSATITNDLQAFELNFVAAKQ